MKFSSIPVASVGKIKATQPKIVLFSQTSQQFLSMVPNETNDIGCAIWTPNRSQAMELTMDEAVTLSDGWPYLNTCEVIPVPKGV